ncbi:DivIVA domain-containing protein [Allonocardiopsis opalescens]|uniref:Cell wall synthesis protein Wag31 n=1 Tax=Allonocardiopsis opalescens TaxID=1144618 RepID=A0A2T0QAH7_9ACTN|nr:DivIVA domain-containing protein [Allonocardiopsis opalescens]PRY00879.1 cell division initiation protein [Allonocardiopsis opalescens]
MTVSEDTWTTRGPQPRLSPEQVRAQEFGRTSLGRRGLNEDEVRQFLHRVAEEIAAGDAEKLSLRSDLERLRDRFRATKDTGKRDSDDEQPQQQQPRRPSAEAVNVLAAAQQQADAYIAQAQDYARRVTVQAREQAELTLREAQERAEEAADEAGRVYRAQAGERYAAELEEMERRVAWLKTFCHAVQVQMQAASDAFAKEIGRLGELSLSQPDLVKAEVRAPAARSEETELTERRFTR